MPVLTLGAYRPSHHTAASCRACRVFRGCLPERLTHADVRVLDSLVVRRPLLRRGEPAFHMGQTMHYVYLIRAGSVKTYTPVPDGGEHVTGFRLAGEVLGLDGLAFNRYRCSAVALESTSLCALPTAALFEGFRAVPAIAQHMLGLMSRELAYSQDLRQLLGHASAEQRLASFLLGLSQRYSKQGQSATCFSLTMCRRDIADHLGLAVETVSRLLARFHLQGVLSAHGKRVEIRSSELLTDIAHGPTDTRTVIPGMPVTPQARETSTARGRACSA